MPLGGIGFKTAKKKRRLLSRDDLEATVDRAPSRSTQNATTATAERSERLARDLLHGSEQFAQSCKRDGQHSEPGGVRREGAT